MRKLTDQEAIQILPAVVDNEATQVEKDAFFEFIAENETIRKEYEDALFIKKLLSERLPVKRAPDELKSRISKQLNQLQEEYRIGSQDNSTHIDFNHSDTGISPKLYQTGKHAARYLTAAAVILLFTLVTIELLNQTTPIDSKNTSVMLESVSLQHFLNHHNERFFEPVLHAVSITEAEQYLADQLHLNITIPQISNAEFSGIAIADFMNNYITPVLKYRQMDIDETIYIFAFLLSDIFDHNELSRNHKAVEKCKTNEDFYITVIDQHHVLSWLWDDIWYTAVSNHNGYDLASLVEPLNYSP